MERVVSHLSAHPLPPPFVNRFLAEIAVFKEELLETVAAEVLTLCGKLRNVHDAVSAAYASMSSRGGGPAEGGKESWPHNANCRISGADRLSKMLAGCSGGV